jgi:hypothetical protein
MNDLIERLKGAKAAEVVQFPTPSLSPNKWAAAWEGLVRMMEANGRARIEISLEEARRVAAMARKAAK